MPVSIVDKLFKGFHMRYTESSWGKWHIGLYIHVHFPHVPN